MGPLDKITVCKSCQRASCWQTKFPCNDFITADIVQHTRAHLESLKLEHPDYLKTDDELATEGA